MRFKTQLYIMLSPFLLGLILLVALPAVGSMVVAFFDYSPLRPTEFPWVGLKQFEDLFKDPLFWKALGNSLMYTLISVPLRVFGAVAIAFFLDRKRRGVGGYRSASYLPTIIPDVAYGLTWLWIFNPLFGPVSQVLRSVGQGNQSWLLNETGARSIVILMGAWQIGEGIVIMLAALRDIPPDLRDAALVDGAGRWARLRSLVLPIIAPTFLLLTFRTTVVTLQDNFAPAYIVTNGNPYYATYYLPLKIYINSFNDFRFSYGAAMIMILYAAAAIIVFAQYMSTRRWSLAAYE